MSKRKQLWLDIGGLPSQLCNCMLDASCTWYIHDPLICMHSRTALTNSKYAYSIGNHQESTVSTVWCVICDRIWGRNYFIFPNFLLKCLPYRDKFSRGSIFTDGQSLEFNFLWRAWSCPNIVIHVQTCLHVHMCFAGLIFVVSWLTVKLRKLNPLKNFHWYISGIMFLIQSSYIHRPSRNGDGLKNEKKNVI